MYAWYYTTLCKKSRIHRGESTDVIQEVHHPDALETYVYSGITPASEPITDVTTRDMSSLRQIMDEGIAHLTARSQPEVSSASHPQGADEPPAADQGITEPPPIFRRITDAPAEAAERDVIRDTLHNPKILYQQGIHADSYTFLVDASRLSPKDLATHNKTQDLINARRAILDSQRDALSGEGLGLMEPRELFNLLKQTKVGNIPTCPTCLRCFSAEDVLETHLMTSECSTLKWLHAPRLIRGRNKAYMCPYCSDFCKQDRRAVMNHYNTDPACRRLLLADLNMQDEYLARYDFERRGAHTSRRP